MSLKDMLSHIPGIEVTDDDPQPVKPAAKPAESHPAPAPQPYVPAYPSSQIQPPFTAAALVDHDDDVYKRLLSKTDFKTTPAFASVQKYLTPLANFPLDEKTKFKMAVVQAQAQEGVSTQSIMAAFDSLKAALQHEAEAFAATIQSATEKEVNGRQSQIQQLTTQLQGLQAQITKLTEDSFAAQQKIQTAQHKFETAFNARTTELDNEKNQYNTLLQ